MKQRSMILAAVMLPFAVAIAQTPPTPPVTPVAPVSPVTPVTPLPPVPGYPVYIDRDEIRRITDEARRIAEDARWELKTNLADAKLKLDHDLKFNDFKLDHGLKFDFNHDFKFDFDHDIRFQDFKVDVPHVSVQVPSFNYAPMPPGQGGSLWMPGQRQQQWQDPADSIYQLGREALNRQDYSRAAARFAEMIAKYPNSRQVPGAAYYQALSLFRVGTLDALRNALKVLETNEQRFAYDYNRSYRTQAPTLHASVLRALADRNDAGAEGKLRELIAKYPDVSCDKDKIDIQSQVLNSLYESDPEAAMPFIRQHLATRDACTANLRSNAIWQLAKRPTDENTNAIVNIAKVDTVRSVRMRAIDVLSRMPGDAAITALQQFMTDNDEQIQNAAVRSLMRSDNPKARAAMRTLIDRRESSERQRTEAIGSFDRDNTSPEDAAYLRGLFNRTGESDRVKEAVIRALGNVPTDENLKFMMDVAQNPNESSSIRSAALRRVTARQNLTTDNLIKLYDATDNRSMRNSLVDALGQRPETAAVEKLLSIVKLSTDPDVRSNAIQILLRKNDKTITQKVLELIK